MCIENNEQLNSPCKYNTSSELEHEQHNTSKKLMQQSSPETSISSTSQASSTKITYRKKIPLKTQIKYKINAKDNWNTALITRHVRKSTKILNCGNIKLTNGLKNTLTLAKYTVSIA